MTTRAISRPVVKLTAAMTRIADGANDVAITGSERRNELGAMLVVAGRQLRQAVG